MKTLVLALGLMLTASNAWAGAGHDHGESQFGGVGATTSFELENTTITNLDIKAITADINPVRESTRMLMQIKLLPEKQAVITPRFQGKVTDIKAKLGDSISRGQPLVTLQPVSIGNAPVALNAPISGVLSRQIVVTGQVVNPGDILMEVSDRVQVLAKGVTYEIKALGTIRNGQKVEVKVDSLPQKTFAGTVQRIDPAIDEDERTFSIFALLDNPDELLIPHMQGQMEIFTGEEEQLLTIPAEAVLGTVGQHFIYVKDENYFEKRDVILGVSRGGQREIISGVFPGENVVIQGNYQLQYVSPARKEQQDAASGDHEHAH